MKSPNEPASPTPNCGGRFARRRSLARAAVNVRQEEVSVQNPELCVNLWFFVDQETGFVNALAGRGYFLSGSDEEKTKSLKKEEGVRSHMKEEGVRSHM
jgi:hypothetical protein